MKNILCLLTGLIIGIILGIFIIQILNIPINTSKTHSVLEVVYYLTSPIGVLFTVVAVVVAIWGNDIRAWFNKEKCEVEIENGGFVEDVRGIEDDENMSARQYNCNLIIKNTGPKEIECCAVFITKIIYKADDNSKGKNIGFTNRMPLYWFNPNVKTINILKDEQRNIPVLRVYPDSHNQTPDQQNTQVTPRQLSVMGFSIDGKYNKKGTWEISYLICNSHESLKTFKLVIQWNGDWRRREKEMNECLTVHMVK